ncbi:hypothetical protein F5878DRAFT_729669 [Lentinula raphanica]|uniref:Uncharacterized protein n=1 Tax=Lentinula raphanica TaxID=153919 RepID=A0AA38NVM2_9AGAR|nr:hypothetical protein F5878DRAFT_729669 [Lentinula raphanica]
MDQDGDDRMSGSTDGSKKRKSRGGDSSATGDGSTSTTGSAPQPTLVGPSGISVHNTDTSTGHASAAPGSSRTKKPRLDKGKNKEAPKGSNGNKKRKKTKTKKKKFPSNQTNAFYLHLRILWRLFSKDETPPLVTAEMILRFNERFASTNDAKAQIDQIMRASHAASAEALAKVQDVKRLAWLASSSKTSQNIQRVEDVFLERLFSSVAAIGLEFWNPDVAGGSPESLYNSIHEHIAITTFQVLLSAFAYRVLAPDMSLAKNYVLCRQIYQHFVFHYIGKKMRKEARKPGSLKEQNERDNANRRKSRLRENRVRQIKADGFNKRFLALAEENDAHSDDEPDPTTPGTYLIHPKQGRSANVTAIFRKIDERYQHTLNRPQGQRNDRIRKTPDTPLAEAHPSRRPLDVPIDYFEPVYFNTLLSARDRARYAKNGVAMPIAEKAEDVSMWKNLDEDEFMDRYGKAVLKLYLIPTEEELEQLDEYENTDDSDTSDEED